MPLKLLPRKWLKNAPKRILSKKGDFLDAKGLPDLGIGIGLRIPHYEYIFENWPAIDWFEIISENFMQGGRPLEILDKVKERYPVVLHGVSLSIGSPAPLDWDYLKSLKRLVKRTKTPWVSDHLSWGRLEKAHYHDLLPLPYTEEVARFVAHRARQVQDFLEVPFALENVSSYAGFCSSEMPEWEFYRYVAEEADIAMMLDVNNVFVSSVNHQFDPYAYLEHLPMERVLQIHLAGHTVTPTHLIDTHDNTVRNEVWELYRYVMEKRGRVSTLLEWDDHFLSFEETWQEALKAKEYQKALKEQLDKPLPEEKRLQEGMLQEGMLAEKMLA